MADDTIRTSDDMSDDVTDTDDTRDDALLRDEEILEEDMPEDFTEDEVFGNDLLEKDKNSILADDIAADKDADFSEPEGLDLDDDEESWMARSIREGAERGMGDDDENYGAYGYSIVDGDTGSSDDSF